MDKARPFGYNPSPMEMPVVSSQKNLALKNMFIIGGAWFGMSAFFAFNMSSIPLFFNERIEQKWVVGLILGMMGFFGIVVAPFVGIRSDKIRHRLGRRRPLIIFGLPFVVAILILTQYLPSVRFMVIIWPLVYFFHMFVERPFSALIPDLFPPDKRATANGVCQLMGGSGNLLYFVLGGYLWTRSQEAAFYLVAVVYAIGVLTVLFGINEKSTHMDYQMERKRGKFLDYIKGLREHDGLLKYALAALFWNTGLNGTLPWLTSFGTVEIGMSVWLSYMILALSVVILILLSVPVGVLADRIGHKSVTSIGLVIFVIINTLVVFAHSVVLVFILMGIVAIGFSIIMVVPYAILVNLIPEERMAELIGIAGISAYLSIFLGPFFTGLLIDAFGSYRPIFAFAAACHAIGLVLLQRVKVKSTYAKA